MKLNRFCILAALFFGLASLSGCSRESSIKENVNLKNNHSVVFAFNTPVKDAEAFADSIVNLANPDSVLAFDTLTVTINDPVYMIGFLRYNADKIYRYAWRLTNEITEDDSLELTKYGLNAKTKRSFKFDTTISGANATIQNWEFEKASIYKALFIAVDGNNARDTAGIHQYIRVIDTPPILAVPKDTLWTRAKGEISFPIVARDSFGTITSIKVDLDANGKGEPEKWDYETLTNDTLLLSIKYDKKYVDSLGNQKIYIIAIDDDKNETKDSVNLHFNKPPKLELLQPIDGSRFSKSERFAFYYKADDVDNPASLRYFIRAAKSRDNSGKPPVLTDNDIIAENIKEKSFEAVSADGKNLINLEGRIYWDVWVTDGYDTVFADHVKDGKTTRPWTFFLGDLEKSTGEFYGYAKYQGWQHHQGIRVTLKDSLGNSFVGSTNDKGYYSIEVPEGYYRLTAVDTSSYRFASDTLPYQRIETGDNILLNPVTLKDTSKPIIYFTDKIDTLTVRDYQIAGKLYDFGSQVKSATTWFDGEETKLSYISTNSFALNLTNLVDGKHSFALTVQDSAGLSSDTLKFDFIVAATSISLNVNNKTSSMVNEKNAFNFEVKILNANPMPDTVIWKTNIEGAKEFKSAVKDSVATLKVTSDMLPETMTRAVFYEMVATTKNGANSNKVRFGYFSDGPVVYFTNPSNDSTITINDELNLVIEKYENNSDPENTTYTLEWNCIGEGISSCFAKNTEGGKISWSKTGEKKIIVTITNAEAKKQSDTLRVNVISDPPTIHVSKNSTADKFKINSNAIVNVSATDKFGTVNKISWGCSNGTVSFDFDTTFTTPQKSISDLPISVLLPGDATNNYKCVFKATDDDNESTKDSVTFKVILDKPYVSLNTKQQELTIKDQTPFKFVAIDTLGRIEKYEYTCDSIKKNLNSNWINFESTNMTLTMPPEACTWYCVIRVTDDDGNTAKDTATYTVLLDPPTVQVLGDYTVTIKDTVGLDAMAYDKFGKIVLYEWGCGSKNTSIGFTHSSTTTPSYDAVMPATAQNDYRCIIRVTDDDGNTAKDTTHIDIILAPPSISVATKNVTVREGYNIVLDANAYDYPDYPGYIKVREWSCGSPSDIDKNWKNVSQYDTVWKAPAAAAVYYCIARATDDDGNSVMDTMHVTFSTDIPIISVTDDEIYVLPGEKFELNAEVNNVWQGINWFTWECIDAASGKSMEKTVTKYDYYKNGESFYDFRDESYTNGGKKLKCIVTAEESSTKATFSDTTVVNMINQPPQGVITAADTVYLWSGDESVSDEALYFYTEENDTPWGGTKSILGTIGDKNNQEFWWSFSNVDGGAYYQGKKDGTIDTSIAQFNSAFIRNTYEGGMTICLDYRDSTTEHPTQSFYTRHRAEETCRNVYFRKAWKNLATTDTVLEQTKMTTPPVITTVANKPVIAYLKSSTVVGSQYLSGSTWKTLSTSSISASDSITTLQIANNKTDLYLAVLTSGNDLTIYRSASGTSAWAKLGNSFKASNISLSCNPVSNQPVVSYVDKNDGILKFSHWDGSSWKAVSVNQEGTDSFTTISNCRYDNRKRKDVCDTTKKTVPSTFREVTSTFTEDGKFVVINIDMTSDYHAFYSVFTSSYTQKTKNKYFANNMSIVNLASHGSTLYMGFINRDTENYGPYVYKGTVGDNISWNTSGVYGKSISPGLLAYHIQLATSGSEVYLIVDDKGKTNLAQSHVYHLNGDKWVLLGENELPYFKVAFYNKKKYYLRGSVPDIAVSDEGKVYISMLGWAASGNSNNFGPIIMKYVADTWKVH